MKRTLGIVLVVSILGATPAFAAGPDPSPSSAAAPKSLTFNSLVKSAGLDQIVADQSKSMARRDLFATTVAPRAAKQKKSFWKTPWPYVIAGGVIAAGLIIAYSGDGSGNGY